MTRAFHDAARITLVDEARAMTVHALTAFIELLDMAVASTEGDEMSVIEVRLAIYEGELYARAALP